MQFTLPQLVIFNYTPIANLPEIGPLNTETLKSILILRLRRINMKKILKQVKSHQSKSLWILLSIFSLTSHADNQIDNQAQTQIENQLERIDAFFEESVEHGFSGAMLVAKGDKILLNKGYGFADKAKKHKNTANTVFDIGSVTKQFTAAAVLTLVEQKKLSLSDPLNKFFEHLPKDKQNITLHQLLSHSSGLVGGLGEGDFYHITTDKFFSQLFATELLFAPGTQFHYSNVGYSTLARVIELVSHTDYEEYINRHLFQPTGMQQTGYLLPDWQSSQLSKGYGYNVFDVGSMVERYQKDGKIAWTLKGNGGINSTQNDMYKWYLALRNNSVLTKQSLTKLTTPYIKERENSDVHYAYGWGVFNSKRDTKVVTHNGSNGISYHNFRWFVDEDIVIIYSTNALTPEIEPIIKYVEEMMFNPTFSLPQINVAIMTKIISTVFAHKGSDNKLVALLKEKYASQIAEFESLALASHILFHNNYSDKAFVLYQLNVTLFPNEGEVWDMLGEAYFRTSDFKAARKNIEKALSLIPDSETNCEWCGYSRARLKEMEQSDK